jgi:hypothetical protein
MLVLSTNSYMRQGEVAGYAEKIAQVSKAARYMKAGGHVGIALIVVASGVAIHQACSVGREEECTEAKYIEGGKLGGSVLGGIAGGGLASVAGTYLCIATFGVATGGLGIFACLIVSGGVSGYVGGLYGSQLGESVGRYLYK